jgi:FkbM family methyltransferase
VKPGRGRAAAFLAAVLLAAACRRADVPAPPPSYDIRQVATEDLLRRANHGRDVLGPDGRFAIPARVRRVWIDVGAHHLETTKDPLEENNDLVVIAIEPQEECWTKWPDRVRLIALPVAISTDRGWMEFHVNADNATSSLLDSVAGRPKLDKLTQTVEKRQVPVLRLQDVIERVPPGLAVEYVKTDVQGHDLQVLKSAGESLRRVTRVKAEIINAPIYAGRGEWRPGTEAEFVSYMESQGFAFDKDTDVQRQRAWLDKHFINRNRGVR